jgi:hypothetical protein
MRVKQLSAMALCAEAVWPFGGFCAVNRFVRAVTIR